MQAFFLYSSSMSRFSRSGRLSEPSVGQARLFVLRSPRFFEPIGGFSHGFRLQRVIADQHFDSECDHERGITFF